MHSSKPYRIPGLELVDHYFQLPLDYDRPNGRKIRVFAREVRDLDPASVDKPFLLFLSGGPGFRAPLPIKKQGWLKRALQDYRVLLYDTRGNGMSTPVDCLSLPLEGDAQGQADYLKHFRADNIVRDAEAIRAELSPGREWSTIGQSYGGWCTMTYLSLFPKGLKECFIFGGVPGLDQSAREIYEGTFPLVEERNRIYFDKFPMDKERLARLSKYLLENEVRMPNGDRLTPRRLQLLGIQMGFADTMQDMHFLIEEALMELDGKERISFAFLKKLSTALSFDSNPIFAILHEAIYAQQEATRWACDAIQKELYPHYDDYEDFRFYGEMIFPWMFDEFSELRGMKEVANLLAEYEDWPKVYNKDVLKESKVPVACVVYTNDMFVNARFSKETIDFVPNMNAWFTSEYEHCGMRADGERILSRLIDLMRGEIER